MTATHRQGAPSKMAGPSAITSWTAGGEFEQRSGVTRELDPWVLALVSMASE